MGFGSFLVNAGNAYIGAADQAEKLARLRQQQMVNDKHAAEIRARREQEAFEAANLANERAKLARAPITASTTSTSDKYTFNNPATVTQQSGFDRLKLAPNEEYVPPSGVPSIHVGGRNPNVAAPTEAELTANIAAGKAKLDRLKSNPTNQVKLDRDAAAGWGAAAKDLGNMALDANPITGTIRALKGTEGPLLSNIVNPAKNLINRGVNAVIGEPTYRTDFPTGKPINPNALQWRKEDPVPEISATKKEIARQEAQLKKLKETPVTKPTAKTVVAERAPSNIDVTAEVNPNDPLVQQQFIDLLIPVESSGNASAKGPALKRGGNALGLTQITPPLVAELNKRGIAVDLKTKEGQLAATKAAVPVIAEQLQSFGVPVTMEALLSAWLQGAGGVARNGVYAENVKDSLGTTPKAYIRNILAKAGASDSGATQIPSGDSVTPGLQKVADNSIPNGTEFSTGVERELPASQDPTGAMYDDQIDTAKFLIQNAPTLNQVLQAKQALYQATTAKYEHQVSALSNAAASGNPEALGQMVAMYNRINGTNYGYASLSDGRVALATREGRVIAPPSDPKLISRSLLEGISPAIRQIAASTAQEYNKAFATESGKIAATGPWDANKERIKANTEIQKALITSQTEILKAIYNSKNTGKPTVVSDTTNGGAFVVTPEGVLYQGPNIDVEGVSTAPALRPIASTQEMMLLLQSGNTQP